MQSYNEYLDIMGMSQERYKLDSNKTEIKQEIKVDRVYMLKIEK